MWVWGVVGCLPVAAVSTCESAFRVAGLGALWSAECEVWSVGVSSAKCGM